MERHAAPACLRSGTLITTPYDGGPVVQQDTVSCVHCQHTWVWTPGSGRTRGWCSRCNGLVCGPLCGKTCVPLEQWLENVEAGRPDDHRPVRVSTAGLILPG